MTDREDTIQVLFGRGTTWEQKNLVLKKGEHGFEWDTGLFKVGNGIDSYNDLDYFIPRAEVVTLIESAIADIPDPSASLQNLLTLVQEAEESDDITALAVAVQNLADTPPEVTQVELDAKADSDRVTPLNDAVEGLGYYVYGASYEGANTMNYSNNTRFPFRVARRLGLIQVNYAISGDESTDMFFNMSELNSTRKLAPNTKGIIHIAGATNDALRDGLGAYREATFKNNLKACIYRAFCSSIIPATDAAVVYSAGWMTGGNGIGGAFASTMNYKYTNTPNATATVSLTGDTLVVFSYDLGSPSYSIPAGRIKVAVDGVVKSNRTPELSRKSLTGAGWSVSGVALPLLGNPAGAHEVVVTAEGATASIGAFLQSFGAIDKTNLPQIIIPQLVTLIPGTSPGGYTHQLRDTYRRYVNEVVAEVIAEIPEAAAAITTFVPDKYWDPATMLGSDFLHPTDKGEAALARQHTEVLSALPFRKGMNK